MAFLMVKVAITEVTMMKMGPAFNSSEPVQSRNTM